jgi:hypothetical protein
VVGFGLAGLAGLFLALIVASLVASPGLLPLRLPGVGSLLPNAAAPKIAGGPGHKAPAGQLVGPGARVSPSPATDAPVSSPTRVATPAASPTTHPTPHGTGAPTAHPTPTGTGSTTANPTPRGTGSPTTHPTSHGTGKPAARPTQTPSAVLS